MVSPSGAIAAPRICADGDKIALRGLPPEPEARPALSRCHPPWSGVGSRSARLTCLARLARVAFAVCGGGTWMPDPGEPCPGFALRPACVVEKRSEKVCLGVNNQKRKEPLKKGSALLESAQ